MEYRFLIIFIIASTKILGQDTLSIGNTKVIFYPPKNYVNAMKKSKSFKEVIQKNAPNSISFVAYYVTLNDLQHIQNNQFNISNTISIAIPNNLIDKSAKELNIKSIQMSSIKEMTGISTEQDMEQKEKEIVNKLLEDSMIKNNFKKKKVELTNMNINLVFDSVLNNNSAFFMTINKMGLQGSENKTKLNTVLCCISKIVRDRLILVNYLKESDISQLEIQHCKKEAIEIINSFK